MTTDILVKNPYRIPLKKLEMVRELIDRLGLKISVKEVKKNECLVIDDSQEYENYVCREAKSIPDRISLKSYRHFAMTFRKGSIQSTLTWSVPLFSKHLVSCGGCDTVQIHKQPSVFLPFTETLQTDGAAAYCMALFLLCNEKIFDSYINNQIYLWAEEKECLQYLQEHPDYIERSFEYHRRAVLKLVDILGEDNVREIING